MPYIYMSCIPKIPFPPAWCTSNGKVSRNNILNEGEHQSEAFVEMHVEKKTVISRSS